MLLFVRRYDAFKTLKTLSRLFFSLLILFINHFILFILNLKIKVCILIYEHTGKHFIMIAFFGLYTVRYAKNINNLVILNAQVRNYSC